MSTNEKIIKPKLGVLELARQLGNVGEFGYTDQWIPWQNDHFEKSFNPSVFLY